MSDALFELTTEEAPNWAAEREERGEPETPASAHVGARLPLAPPKPGSCTPTASTTGYWRLIAARGWWPDV